MSNGPDRNATDDEQIAEIMERLNSLESSAQAEAVIDLEKAFVGGPMIDRPLWLRGVSNEVIVGVRNQLMTVSNPPVTKRSAVDADAEAKMRN
jgi:hypothetical protein